MISPSFVIGIKLKIFDKKQIFNEKKKRDSPCMNKPTKNSNKGAEQAMQRLCH